MAVMGDDDADAGNRQREGAELVGLQPLAGAQHRQADGEEDLHLHHQGGQARRDHAVHGDEQKSELAQPDGDAINRQIGQRHFRPGRKNTIGTSTKVKRKDANSSGGSAFKPSRMMTKLVPQTNTTASASIRSRKERDVLPTETPCSWSREYKRSIGVQTCALRIPAVAMAGKCFLPSHGEAIGGGRCR